MRDYSKASARFWTGDTGRELRGYADGQRVAFYLFTCPSSNMIGMYYLSMPTLMHEIGISKEGASKALRRVYDINFARYDPLSEYVWVIRMAFEQIGRVLVPKDKRHLGVIRELEQHRKSPFFNDFLDLYTKPFHLETVVRADEKQARAPSPFEGASKPHRSQEQEQEQDIEQERGNPSVSPLLEFGEFHRVLLTHEQHARLLSKLNGSLEHYINRFDRWADENPKTTANRKPYNTILNWYERDLKDGRIYAGESKAQQRSREQTQAVRVVLNELDESPG